ncbi:MAG TPA: thrombospondin type 3 repeat-containing protein [Saprospiraceae bacterium]|nr:thrombospondin type 3 repeat-containing protein [Saprospiraceae bacterium]
MNSFKAILSGLFLLLCLGVMAQEPTTNNGKNFVSAKLLFLDYQGLNGGESNFTNGLEIAYRRNINDYLALGIPLKAGFISVVDDMNNRNFFSLDAIVRGQLYQTSARVVPYIFTGIGYVSETDGVGHSQIPVGGGIDLRVGASSYLNVQAEYRVSGEAQRDNLQIGLGYVYRLGKAPSDRDGDGVPDEADVCPDIAGKRNLAGCPDSDGDGVADQQDACPNEAGLATAQGCPDRDGDGVPDKDDECPEVAGTVNGCPDRDGDGVVDKNDRCPDKKGSPEDGCPEEQDRDNDGVPDAEDACPDVAGDLDGCPDSDGDGLADKYDNCPEVSGTLNGCPDRDGDGIADKDDDCPDEAGNNNGCPEEEPEPALKDSDGDGFADEVDFCPEEAGSINGCPDSDGDKVPDPLDKCPEVAGPMGNDGCPEIREEDRKVLDFAMQAVRFESGKAILLEESFQVLDQIAAIMKRYPEYHLEISGHTDDVGAYNLNQILSEDRAKACYLHLLSQGIEPGRMSYVGHGQTKPIADNGSSSGRMLNRRTEFRLYLP